jgi:CRISPR system Cascade subunit CasC
MVVSTLLNASGLTVKSDEESKTEYLLFMPERSLGELASLIAQNWEQLKTLGLTDKEEKAEEGKPKKSNKKKKADAEGAASDAIGKDLARAAVDAIYGTANTPELALFGRMIADRPETNVDASCQVAHAISTHRVAMEFDYYTAVDDLKPRDNSGADMIGTIAFNSACFYRYSVLDVEQLARNLAAKTHAELLTSEEKGAAVQAAKSWLEASFNAIPSARQNTFAAWTPPELVITAVRSKGASLSLANAFAKPIRVDSRDGGDGLMPASATALAKHYDEMRKLVDDQATIRVTSAGAMTTPTGSEVVESFPKLVASIGNDLATWAGA